MSKRPRRSPLGPVLLGTAAAVMVSLLFYALLVTEPPVAYVVGLVAAAGVTGWAALECLFCDWAGRGSDGHRRRRPPPSPSGQLGVPGHGQVGQGGRVHAPAQPVRFVDAGAKEPSVQESVASVFRRPPTRRQRTESPNPRGEDDERAGPSTPTLPQL
jgi:hypothetical protein